MSGTGTSSGLQCCVICGRTLTDRSLHDDFERVVLAAIRSEHPEWVDTNGACDLCIRKYRMLLKQRRIRAGQKASRPTWLARLIRKFGESVLRSRKRSDEAA
jgi:hypothetical protein